MNAFNSLCELASEEQWCWKLICTTCGHLHFRYALLELCAGRSPLSSDWLIHSCRTQYSMELGEEPRSYSIAQKDQIIKICIGADLNEIAAKCRFPDWLGYLGLILEHMYTSSSDYRELSTTWAKALLTMVQEHSLAHMQLQQIMNNEGRMLTIYDLEQCEYALAHKIHNANY